MKNEDMQHWSRQKGNIIGFEIECIEYHVESEFVII